MKNKISGILKMDLANLNLACFDRIVNAAGLFFIVLGVSQSIYMNLLDRSLWLDEAMLASSLSQRSLFSLTAKPLDFYQVAPPVYLYICKIITIIFGNTEFTLRLLSIASYIICIYLVYVVSNRILAIKYPLLCSAFVANVEYMLRYSNEFKQYMFESMVVLLILYTYGLYRQKVITWKFLFIFFPVSIWCANPSCFIIGGVLLSEVIFCIIQKNKDNFIKVIYISLSVCISFISYYFYWLNSTSNTKWLAEWWTTYFFPIIPTSTHDIDKILFIFSKLFYDYSRCFNSIIIVIIVYSLIKGVFDKNRYITALVISIFLCLLASYLKKFPIHSRVCLFMLPLLSLILFYGVSTILCRRNFIPILLINLVISVIMILLNLHFIIIQNYFREDVVYRKNNEPNFVVNYLQQNIRNDEKLFVFHWAIPALKYKIGYNSQIIGNNSEENIIWSNGTFPDDFYFTYDITEDLSRILQCDVCYIFGTLKFETDRYFGKLLNQLNNEGFLELSFTKYANHLYLYTSDAKKLKQKAGYRIVYLDNTRKKCKAIIRIINDGIGYIGGTQYDKIIMSSKDHNNIKVPLNTKIEPAGNVDVLVEFEWNDQDTFLELQLYNEGKFWFDELGCKPVRISRPL